MDLRGSCAAVRAAGVAGSAIDDPSSDTRSVGAPVVGVRKFQPVYVPSGTATSGSLIPASSLPSASTCGTSSGSGDPAPAPPAMNAFATRVPAAIARGEATPGIAGNAIAAALTSVRSFSVGYALGGGAAPTATQCCMASSNARIDHQ